jgi:hypothetical protein
MRIQALILINTAMYRNHAPSEDAFAHAVREAKINPAIR